MESSDTHTNGNGTAPEVIDEDRHLPVLATEARPLERRYESPLPAPVIATGGFLAGIAALLFVRVLRRSSQGRRRGGFALRPSKRRQRSMEIAGSKSFLVDVHVLKR
jgi:hypothetical protein